ncbi:hypothetical protein VP01_12582g1, partial [Puccinia sorghi]
ENLIEQSLIPQTRTLRDRTTNVKPVKYSYLTGYPESFLMAMKSDNRDQWIRAANEELSNIEGHDVWDDQWEEPTAFLKTVSLKFLVLITTTLLHLPVNSILIVLMLAIDRKLPIQQFDMKILFLFAPLKETLYIKTPEGCKEKPLI